MCDNSYYVCPSQIELRKTCSYRCAGKRQTKRYVEGKRKYHGIFKKGQKAWNKGFRGLRWQNTSNMINHNKKHGVWNKGKKRLDISGKNHWNYGNKMSDEHKEKLMNGQKKYIEEFGGWFKGKKFSKEHKEKLKEARKYQITPIKDSSIEVKIKDFLKKLGIEFFTHQYMKIDHGYQCDILIPSMNLVIECDGNYWHKYPVGLEKDHIRTEELIEKGFKVLRLWEHEIKSMDLNSFKGRLGE